MLDKASSEIVSLPLDRTRGVHALRRRALLVRKAKIFALLGLIVLIGAGAAIIVTRQAAQTRAFADTADIRLYVRTVLPKQGSDVHNIVLPGTLLGQTQTGLFARSNGYLLRWTHDIGSVVRRGEVLAEIDTPEVDQQLDQATAQRRMIASQVELAKISARRWEQLGSQGVVSRQDLDEQRAKLTQAEASLAAADAEIRRLREMQSFKRIVAPFSGVITERNVNVGDLISAPGSGTTARPVFVLTRTDSLRLYVQVPQFYTREIKPGMSVSVTQDEAPGRLTKGHVQRAAGAIDVATRTMQVEIGIDDTDEQLLPGAYVQVSIPVDDRQMLVLPANTLLFRPEGVRVAVLGADGRAHLKDINIGRDYGAEVEVTNGISATDKVILNPPATLSENDPVTETDVAQERPQ
jgi:RND family efflux transporter MFP subunit